MDRREFVKSTGFLLGGAAFGSACGTNGPAAPREPLFRISLAQWAINSAFTTRGGTLDNLEFARVARENGYEGLEYVNQFFFDKARDQAYLAEMKRIADGEGLTNVLIMIDREGALGDPDEGKRTEAVENHYKWVEAAKVLGCHAIRVNAYSGPGTWEEQLACAADGYGRIVRFGADHDINVIIENHGGLSSDPEWLIALMRQTDHPRAGVLPDFGNFRQAAESRTPDIDGYEAVRALMPYSKGLSAKATTAAGGDASAPIDFERMMRIGLDAGFRGFLGIEYGGLDGIGAARQEMAALRDRLTPEYA